MPTVTKYVVQYQGGPDHWIDLNSRDTPEEAFGRYDVFRRSWAQDSEQQLQVVERVITDTVIGDPRLAVADTLT